MTDNTVKIVQLGDPRLREISLPITDLYNAESQQLFKQLLTIVTTSNGMGIAAPQLGYNLRVFIMCSQPNQRYPNAPQMELTWVINPIITHYSSQQEKGWEGCLSIPGIRALVPRHKTIKVQFTNRLGQTINAEYSGFIARLFQHEFDHLDGRVFLDRVEDNGDIVMESQWLKMQGFS